MEDHKRSHPTDLKNHPFLRVFIGIFFSISGLVNILVSLNWIIYIDTRPNQIAIFNDPHTWQVFALGTTMFLFGVANILPPKMRLVAKVNNFLLLASFLAVVVGVILEKLD